MSLQSGLGAASLLSSTFTTSSKAAYRPGKSPRKPNLKRNDSIVSLPSPPTDSRDREAEVLEGPIPRRIMYMDEGGEEEEVGEGEGELVMGETRRVLYNPFSTRASTSSMYRPTPVQSEHNVSPTQQQHVRKQRRVAKERILFEEKALVGMGAGWEDESNPFIVRKGEAVKVRMGPAVKPEKMTYVFRGKRIVYDVGLDALITPEDPTESPFPLPSPRLLFPAPPLTPPGPCGSFLDALRTAKRPAPSTHDYGLPTPMKEREREQQHQGKRGRFGS